MHFILSNSWEEGIDDLAQRLIRELTEGKKVLWLLSGGSNIAASVTIMQSIPPELTSNLGLMLGDERYGEPDHADSNWHQLVQGGFDPKQATVYPVLVKGLSFEATSEKFKDTAAAAFEQSDVIIAQIGMGPDGHIVGILPDSIATQDTPEIAVVYQSEPYQRITLSFTALLRIQAAYVFAYGDGKREALQNLQANSLNHTKQPAQILYELPEAYIYNDQLGEN